MMKRDNLDLSLLYEEDTYIEFINLESWDRNSNMHHTILILVLNKK